MKKSARLKYSISLPAEPSLPNDLVRVECGADLFRDREVLIQESLLENVQVQDLPATSLRFDTCVLKAVNLASGKFPNLRLKDVHLENCDLANVDARGMKATRVKFTNCRMTGFRAIEADCKDVRIESGDQRYLQFQSSSFHSAWFESCNFEEADFREADLRGARFHACKLARAEMYGAKLAEADLRGSQIEGVRLHAADVFGATVDAAQAMVLAALLGIKIC